MCNLKTVNRVVYLYEYKIKTTRVDHAGSYSIVISIICLIYEYTYFHRYILAMKHIVNKLWRRERNAYGMPGI